MLKKREQGDIDNIGLLMSITLSIWGSSRFAACIDEDGALLSKRLLQVRESNTTMFNSSTSAKYKWPNPKGGREMNKIKDHPILFTS